MPRRGIRPPPTSPPNLAPAFKKRFKGAGSVSNIDGTMTVSSHNDGLMVSTASYHSGVTPDETNNLERNDYTYDPFGRVLTQTHSRTGIVTMGIYLDTGASLSVTDAGRGTENDQLRLRQVLGRRLSVNNIK